MNTRIKTLIVDDEKSTRIVLKQLLRSYFAEELEIIGEAESVEEALILIENKKPELLFLDIKMPKQSGFDLLNKFKEIPFEIIFVTGYDKYAINAIKFSALDYLLKPVEVKDLRFAVEKAIKNHQYRQSKIVQVFNLLNNLTAKSDEKNIAVHSGENVVLVNATDIISIESNGSYSEIITELGSHTLAKNLKDFESFFGVNSSFIRIHKSVLINSRRIKKYSKGEPCIIEMTNGKTYEVARRKKTEILDHLNSL